MKRTILSLIFSLVCAQTANAACYADYKAKQDDPLRLHYGVSEISGPCTKANAAAQLPARLETDGWQLLNILNVFDEAELDQRKEEAGDYFLRY